MPSIGDAGPDTGCVNLVAIAVVAIAVVGVLLCWQGPAGIAFGLALIGWAALRGFARIAEDAKADDPSLRTIVVAGALDDLARIVRNVAIGLGVVVVAQILLNLAPDSTDPKAIGTFEQRVWDHAASLEAAGSLKIVAVATLGALLVSALAGSVLPFAVSARVRKAVSSTATVLASAAMFSFVTAGVGETNLADSTAAIRAGVLTDLTRAADARRDAVAFRRVSEEVAPKRLTPAARAATRRLFREGILICDAMDESYETGGLVRLPDVSMRNPPIVYVKPNDQLCDPTKLTVSLVARLTMRPGFYKEDAPARAAGREWLPDFAGVTEPVPPPAAAPEAIEIADPKVPAEPPATFRLRLLRLFELEALIPRAADAAKDAAAKREAMRGVAVKAIATLIGNILRVEDAAGKIVDALRDAALKELAKRGEARIRTWLGLLATDGTGAPAAFFPDDPPIIRPPADERQAARAAEEVWEGLHPGVTTAAAAVAAGVTVGTTEAMKRHRRQTGSLESPPSRTQQSRRQTRTRWRGR